jgi:hypothetical protein
MAALQDAWVKLPAKVRKAIDPSGCPATLKQSAEAFDAQRQAMALNDAAVDDLNNMVLGE